GDPFGGGGGGAGEEPGGAGGVQGECGEDANGPAEVYAHSASVLYRIDAATKQVIIVGTMCMG
ncbi:MAG: hypothetical protein RMJ98_15840, partial [Myxococcales bacterium]|nr:hypothetical protein [Myxococcales bacterium]